MSDIGQIDYSLDLGEHSFVAYVGGGYEILKNGERWLDRIDCFSLEGTKAIFALLAHAHQLKEALRESVKLQAHYAELLNGWDGGKRMVFADAEAWIARLGAVRASPAAAPATAEA